MNHEQFEERYREGMQAFGRGEWQAAIAAWSTLPRDHAQYPHLDDLLADARLKAQWSTIEQPVALAPPRRWRKVPLLLLAVLALGFGGYGYFALNPAPAAVAVAVVPSPTATPQPPTATPTAQPTAQPTATPAPTVVLPVPASLVVKPADDQTFIKTPANIEIIVDASGSMFAKVPGSDKERWQVAQDALRSLIASGAISPQTDVIVRTYGRRGAGDCGDLELAQASSNFDPAALTGVIDGIKPAVGGMTPLGASLAAAAEDLRAAEGSTSIILVTDGIESCNGDPVAEAAKLIQDSPQRNVHVIGFAIDDQQASDKLREVATSGNGLYLDAASSEQLVAALRQTIVLGYNIVDSNGLIVVEGTVGDASDAQLMPGSYTVTVNANPPVTKDFVVKNGGQIEITLRQGYGGLVADVQSHDP